MDHPHEFTSLPGVDPTILVDIARGTMPFGRYAGRPYLHVPESYLTWFSERGWPKGRLGVVLATLYEIRANGLEELIREIARRIGDASEAGGSSENR